MPHALYIAITFAFGACIGSFLNVVVWRLPREESLVRPPSHCPKCNNLLKWYDNVPIFGWIKLGGRCRFCKEPISIRYPIVEAVTALLFVFYYVMFYMVRVGPCPPVPQSVFADAAPVYVPPEWPIFVLYLFLIAALLAASLIDADWFLIPAQIPWLVAITGVVVHGFVDQPNLAGALNTVTDLNRTPSPTAALGAGGTVGLIVSLVLWYFEILPTSFPDGEPEFESEREEADAAREDKKDKAGKDKARKGKARKDKSTKDKALEAEAKEARRREKKRVRTEMRKEMLFLLPPMALAVAWFVATTRVPAVGAMWASAVRHDWVSGLLGSLFGGLVGGFVVWLTRILGTLGFGRLAMGLGDVDLMFAVGTVLGAGAATVAFFLAPFFGMLLAMYLLLTGKKRELPYGPYLSLGAGAVMLFYCPIADWLRPGLQGLGMLLSGRWGE